MQQLRHAIPSLRQAQPQLADKGQAGCSGPHLGFQGCFRLTQLLLQLRQRAVLELGSPVEVVVALGALDLQVDAVYLFLGGLQAPPDSEIGGCLP